ncbi:DUF1707 domain-containing protein [Actinoplanes sp. NPDC049599]|uniref:DUF1707 SHOCT-like domain-containing protein n=1 Tax=Actinoplanes sp. NPDC049599 TaxID=3363903 RepID=UPI0037B1F185
MTLPIPPAPSEQQRADAAKALEIACGEGRLTLDEFSGRVGAVWAASDPAELVRATADLAPAAPAGALPEVSRVIAVFSDHGRHGRWRPVRGRPLRATIIGANGTIDLRGALAAPDDIVIRGLCLIGRIEILVPRGVAVEMSGSSWFSARDIDLGTVPPVPGVPVIRIHMSAIFGAIHVLSRD